MKIETQPMMIEKAASPRRAPKTNGFRSLLKNDVGNQKKGETEVHASDLVKEPEQTDSAPDIDQPDESSEEQAAHGETQDEAEDEQGAEFAADSEAQAEEALNLGFDQSLVELIDDDASQSEARDTALAVEVGVVPGAPQERTALTQKDAPLISDWSQAFAAQALDNTSDLPEEFRFETLLQKGGEAGVDQAGLSGGAIKLPQGFTPLAAEAQIPLQLAQPKALEQLNDLVTLQIKASQSPEGAKRLTLLLSPEGLGRMRVLAESDQGRIRVQLKVEQGDAARLIEALLPQLEAQIAASTAMPVEFELIQEDRLSDGDEAANPSLDDESEGSEGGTESNDASLVDEWNQALEETVLERGQTLHVVA